MTDSFGCSRRRVLGGLGALVMLGNVPACVARSNIAHGSASACAGGLCLDLTAAANGPLRTVGGAVLVESTGDTIVVVRRSAAEVAAVSAICTHAGCLVNWTRESQTLDCPCHGSSFATTGAVLRGPAGRAIQAYGATLSGDTVTVNAA